MDRHDVLQGLGDRHDVGPVRGRRPSIAVPETAAVIPGRCRATLTYRRRNMLALAPLGYSLDDFAPRSRAHFSSVV